MTSRSHRTALALAFMAPAFLALAPLDAPVAVGPSVTVDGPAAHGVVDTGDAVSFQLTGDCDAAETTVVVELGTETFADLPTLGCGGALTVPDEELLVEEELDPTDITGFAIETTVGDEITSLPLTATRQQAEHLEVVAGEGTVSDDGTALELAGDSATIALGTVDLAGLHSFSLRYATSDGATGPCTPSLSDIRCIVGRAFLTTGSPHGLPVATAELHDSGGWASFTRVVEPFLLPPDGASELFLTVRTLLPTDDGRLLNVDHVDWNGRGVADAYVPPADPEGTVPIFDGASLDGWQMSGLGHFVVEDGTMKPVGGYGLLWYEPLEVEDFTVRLEFKVSDVRANSGVFVRFDDVPIYEPTAAETQGHEIQIQDYGENYPGSRPESQTGALYGFTAPERIATHDLGEWNHYEITVVGQEYRVVLNGREVSRFTSDRRLSGHIGLQNHDPLFEIAFRNIRVTPHDG